MLLFAGVLVIFVVGCVDIISINAHSDNSDRDKEDVIKEDCSVCGVRKRRYSGLIKGGSATKGFTYPWMVSFRVHKDYNDCAGAIIDRFYILTAAHCVKDPNMGKLSYDTDIHFQSSFPKNMSRGFAIDKIILHPKYRLIDTKVGIKIAKYDIALVKLKNKIKCDAYKNPICLPDANFKLPSGAESEIAGWGPHSRMETHKPPLTRGTMKHLDFANCIKAVPEAKKVKDHMLCGGGTKQTMCYGDSGGPLMYKIKEKYYVVGVTSSETNPSCPPGSPIIFTNVVNFIDWIKKKKNTPINFLTRGKGFQGKKCLTKKEKKYMNKRRQEKKMKSKIHQ